MAVTNPIPTLTSTINLVASLQSIVGSPGLTGATSISGLQPGWSQTFQNASSLQGNAQFADQIYYNSLTLSASGTNVQSLASFTNLLGQASSTFGTGVSALFWWLPTIAQAAANNTTISVQASSVTIGNTASNQFLGPFGSAASKLTLFPGDINFSMRTNGTPWAVTSGSIQNMLFTNNDATNAATVFFFYLGT